MQGFNPSETPLETIGNHGKRTYTIGKMTLFPVSAIRKSYSYHLEKRIHTIRKMILLQVVMEEKA